MENLGAVADSRCTGFREITDRDVLDLQCIIFIGSVIIDKALIFYLLTEE